MSREFSSLVYPSRSHVPWLALFLIVRNQEALWGVKISRFNQGPLHDRMLALLHRDEELHMEGIRVLESQSR